MIVAVVALVLLTWLTGKRMDNRLTYAVVREYGSGCLQDLTELHRASSMAVVANVLDSTAGLLRESRKSSLEDRGNGEQQ